MIVIERVHHGYENDEVNAGKEHEDGIYATKDGDENGVCEDESACGGGNVRASCRVA